LIHLYGWSDALQQTFMPFEAEGLSPARITVQQRGLFRAVTQTGEISATMSGRFVHTAEDGGHPVAGDYVALRVSPDGGMAVIHAVLPRQSVFRRRAAGAGHQQVVAANADVALLVQALNADFNPRRLERYLAAAWESGAQTIIVLTKSDLADDLPASIAGVEAIAFGVPVHAVSAVTMTGMDALHAAVGAGRTAVLLGSSGAGKSTLLNALAGEALMATGALSAHLDKGRHTTTHRELVRLPSGALLLDTPGMRELGLWDADEGVDTVFADIEMLTARCRFSDCHHGAEPGCAIQAGLADGSLDPGRWQAFGKLKRELAFEARKDDYFARSEHKKMWASRTKAYRARQKHLDKG
jgi:ribosome biogenesis GTPase